MMDKWQALDAFWGSFGIPAYDETDVPDDAVMPYITYSGQVGSFESVLLLSGSVWYRSTSWEAPSKKVDEIAEALKNYKLIKLEDDQYLFLTQGAPFAQRMTENDGAIRRIYLNVMGEFFTRS